MNVYQYNGRTAQSVHQANMVNGRVIFIDNSWIDLAGGKRSATGLSTQAITDPHIPLPEEKRKNDDGQPIKRKRFSKSFTGKKLNILNIANADITFKVDPSATAILITMTAYEETLDSYNVQELGGVVSVEGPVQSGRFSNSNVSIVSSNISASRLNIGGVTIVNGKVIGGSSLVANSDERITLEVTLSSGIPITLKGLEFTAEIGDTFADLEVDKSGSGDLKVGKVKSVFLTMNGESPTEIKSVDGKVVLNVNGTSSTTIYQGNATSLMINANGMSKVDYQGSAQVAVVNANGMSNIKIAQVTGQVVPNLNGMSKLMVNGKLVL